MRLKTKRFQKEIHRWYQNHRRSLPWRSTRDPYRILVSEVMLQQTQVDRVIPKYQQWVQQYPSLASLARAKLRTVLRSWSGLGYNRRALALHRTARIVQLKYGGRIPHTHEKLQQLPGIGQYTAAAVAGFAFRSRVPMLDTNIRRVLTRVFFGLGNPSPTTIMQTAQQVLPTTRPDEWHHALMDFGALLCTSRHPRCKNCPIQTVCRAYPKIQTAPTASRPSSPAMKFELTDRYWRGRIIFLLTKHSCLTPQELTAGLSSFGALAHRRKQRLLQSLVQEGFLQANRRSYQIV